MSKMVSARVPDAVYESACAKLQEIGSSPSELVNSAFDFVLRSGTLPTESQSEQRPRTLSKQQIVKLKDALSNCTLGLEPVDDIADDKRIAREARWQKHASLA